MALWEDSIYSYLSVPQFLFHLLHGICFLLTFFSPHNFTALQHSAFPVPLPPQPAWSLPLLLSTLTPPTSWRCEGESHPLHNNPRPFLSLPVPHTNSLSGPAYYCPCFLLLLVEQEIKWHIIMRPLHHPVLLEKYADMEKKLQWKFKFLILNNCIFVAIPQTALTNVMTGFHSV